MYLPFYDWFATKRTSVCFQINQKMMNIIWFLVNLIRFRKNYSASTYLINARKKTAIRLAAVRETAVSQQSCVPNWGYLLKPLFTLQSTIVLKGLRGPLIWDSTMPRETLVSWTAKLRFPSLGFVNGTTLQMWIVLTIQIWDISYLTICKPPPHPHNKSRW